MALRAPLRAPLRIPNLQLLLIHLSFPTRQFTTFPGLRDAIGPRLKIPESDIQEKFLKGSGPGGQKINKTSSAVQLLHTPTGQRVKCQATRSREQNRKLARKLLVEKVDLLLNKGEAREIRKQKVKAKKKASSAKKARRKYRSLEEEKAAQKEDGPEPAVEAEAVEEALEETPDRTTGDENRVEAYLTNKTVKEPKISKKKFPGGGAVDSVVRALADRLDDLGLEEIAAIYRSWLTTCSYDIHNQILMHSKAHPTRLHPITRKIHGMLVATVRRPNNMTTKAAKIWVQVIFNRPPYLVTTFLTDLMYDFEQAVRLQEGDPHNDYHRLGFRAADLANEAERRSKLSPKALERISRTSLEELLDRLQQQGQELFPPREILDPTEELPLEKPHQTVLSVSKYLYKTYSPEVQSPRNIAQRIVRVNSHRKIIKEYDLVLNADQRRRLRLRAEELAACENLVYVTLVESYSRRSVLNESDHSDPAAGLIPANSSVSWAEEDLERRADNIEWRLVKKAVKVVKKPEKKEKEKEKKKAKRERKEGEKEKRRAEKERMKEKEEIRKERKAKRKAERAEKAKRRVEKAKRKAEKEKKKAEKDKKVNGNWGRGEKGKKVKGNWGRGEKDKKVEQNRRREETKNDAEGDWWREEMQKEV